MVKKSYPRGMTEMEWKRKRGMELLRSGMKQAHVARKMGVNRRTVYDWKKRIDDNHDFRNRKKKGRNSLSPLQCVLTLRYDFSSIRLNADFITMNPSLLSSSRRIDQPHYPSTF